MASAAAQNQAGPVIAQAASPGTFLNIYDLWAGNPEPATDPHPGASFGNLIVTGSTLFSPGFGVSLTDPHELEHDLYLSSTSTQTYGEYGFAYTVSMYFPGTKTTLTTPPLVDVYAVSDPNLGDFPDYAPYTQQDAASVAIYQAATRTAAPELGRRRGRKLEQSGELDQLARQWRRRQSADRRGRASGDRRRDDRPADHLVGRAADGGDFDLR